MEQVINLQKIADELEFDLDEVKMLIELFVQVSNKALEELKNGIDTKNFEKIFKSAHKIKGSAANLLLNEISELAKEIEMSGREKNNIDYLLKFNKIELLIKEVDDNLKKINF